MTAIANLVHQASATTGTGDFTLSALQGKQSFNAAFGNGATTNVFFYFISNQAQSEYEWGTGHMSDAATLVRDKVLGGSNGTSAVNFSAGTKDVTNALPAPNLDIVYQTLADAQAAIVPASQTYVRLLGRTTAGDGGASLWKRVGSLPSHPGYFQDASGAYFEFSDPKVNLRALGAVGDGTTDDTTAISNAFAVGSAQGKAVYGPGGGAYVVKSTITITSALTLIGDGREATKFYSLDLNAPMFRFDLTGGSIRDCEFRDFSAYLVFSGTPGTYSSSSAIAWVGSTAGNLFQWSRFKKLEFRGFYQAFLNNAATRTTGFGQEGPINWCDFDDIEIQSFQTYPIYGFLSNSGSGTGNKYRNWNGFIGTNAASSYVFVFNGSGCVVGDIIVTGGQWGSYYSGGGRLMLIGDSTVYRQRIMISDIQCDAGMDAFVVGSSTGSVVYNNIKVQNCNIGGNVVPVSLPTNTRECVVYDKGVSEWRAGVTKTIAGTGAQTTACFTVTLQTNSAVRVEISGYGLIQGVGGAGVTKEINIRSDGSTCYIAAGTSRKTDITNLDVTTSVSGLTTTFNITSTPTIAGSQIQCQLFAQGAYFTAAIV